MSYNPNFYSNIQHFTFQRPRFPYPPPPPTYCCPPPIRPSMSDHDFVKQFENNPAVTSKHKSISNLSISKVKEELRSLVITLNDLNKKEEFLKENIDALSQENWELQLAEIENSKKHINTSLSQINDSYLDSLRKLLAKRSSKRMRLKRISIERKKEKEDWIKELKERSRKIDENLQKIQNDINKAKQEADEKLEADLVLKETLRKKHDAKKCIAKLDALVRLYSARRSTARGRGETPSQRDFEVFSRNIDKLKSLWIKKLQLYETEESELRATLKRDGDTQSQLSERDAALAENLTRWRRFLFGTDMPQRDFCGNVEAFVAVRSQWDQFISPDGTAIPVGWATPKIQSL